MLEGIGKIGSYLNMKQMKLAKDHKIKTGQTLTFDKTRDYTMLSNQKTSKSSSADAIRTASIKQKLKQGEKLSAQEMRYLKENDESLYQKAKKVEKAREELENDLRHAKTKAEARQAVMRASLKAAGEATAQLSAAKAAAGGGGGVAPGGGYQAGQEVGGLNADVAGDVGISGDIGSDVGAALDAGATSDAGAAAEVSLSSESATGLTEEGQQIIADTIASINARINGAGENGTVTDITGDDSQENDIQMEALAGSDGNEEDPAMAILEELMYKLKAIQKTWEKYARSKEYKDMPEDVISDDEKKTKGYTKQESQMLDMVVNYKAQEVEAKIQRLVDIQS